MTMSDQTTAPEPNDPDTPCRCGGRRPSSCSLSVSLDWLLDVLEKRITHYRTQPDTELYRGKITAMLEVRQDVRVMLEEKLPPLPWRTENEKGQPQPPESERGA